MTATRLREAAALMRSRAEAATPGPWEVVEDRHRKFAVPEVSVWSTPAEEYVTEDVVSHTRSVFPTNAAHIASWHPTVALAVADLLDAVDRAARLAGIAADHPEALSIRDRALAVADAYLGDPQ